MADAFAANLVDKLIEGGGVGEVGVGVGDFQRNRRGLREFKLKLPDYALFIQWVERVRRG
jgi:hypothetical protein